MGGAWDEEFPLQDSLVVEFIAVTAEGKAPEYKIGQDGSAACFLGNTTPRTGHIAGQSLQPSLDGRSPYGFDNYTAGLRLMAVKVGTNLVLT